MTVAIPVVQGQLSQHFGHCEHFALFDVDMENKEIRGSKIVESPPHEPGRLPMWLHERGAEVIIAGGMGTRAQQLFAQNGIRVVIGASPEPPEDVVKSYLDGSLQVGDNVCDK
jgi:predicted Fe-Mo cluster-binding NifX family protein